MAFLTIFLFYCLIFDSFLLYSMIIGLMFWEFFNCCKVAVNTENDYGNFKIKVLKVLIVVALATSTNSDFFLWCCIGFYKFPTAKGPKHLHFRSFRNQANNFEMIIRFYSIKPKCMWYVNSHTFNILKPLIELC